MNTIHLQNIGQVEAVAASSLQAGNIVMFNYGVTSQIESIEEVSPKFVSIRFTNGSVSRTMKTKMMAVAA